MGRIADLEHRLDAARKLIGELDQRLEPLERAVNGCGAEWISPGVIRAADKGLVRRVAQIEANLERQLGGPLHEFCEKCKRPLPSTGGNQEGER